MMQKLRSAFLAVLSMFAATVATAQEKVTYLFPAPDFLPAFAPFQLARAKGYYTAEGLDVTFQIGKGGADVAKQVAVGNADLGGGIGDTPLIVRANGLEVKGVALLGGRTLTQIVARKDANIKSLADLKGKKIGVMAFQDTTYYNLLGAMKSVGLGKDDASVQALGPARVVQLMISGDVQAISAVPEWTAAIEAAGIAVDNFDIEAAFPAMAQAILASDKIIKERPKVVKAFVRATLKALREIMADPDASAKAYVAAVPQHAGKEAIIAGIMRRYGKLVYATASPAALGLFDEARMARVQKFYVETGIVPIAVPIAETFTNAMIGE